MKFNHRYLLDYAARHTSPGGRVLDYGCGKADMVSGGRARGLEMYGADVFYKDGASRASVEEKGLLGDAVREIRNGTLDFPDRYFDLVVSNQVFEHVQDIDSALREISRVLKPGATLHALFPVLETWWEGHFGVPFLHNFKSGSRARLAYARAWHGLGLGYHHAGRSAGAWSEYVCDWLDRFTVYRPKREIRMLLERYLGPVEYTETEYLHYRLREAALPFRPVIMGLAAMQPGRLLLKGIYRKRGGVVITVRKSH